MTAQSALRSSKIVLVICLILASAMTALCQVRERNHLSILQDAHRQHYEEFCKQLEKIEEFCKERGLDMAAETIRSRIIPPDLESRNLKSLPTEVVPPIANSLNADDRYWQTQLRSIEKDYAKDLYLLSRRALNEYPGYAFSLVRETALHDPDHMYARKILGFVRQGNEWVTQFAFNQLKKGNVWHEDFGWLPKGNLERYSKGERLFKNRWVSAEKERELRRDFSEAWEIRTDHYLIKTNVSLERGVELGRALEDFHEFFYETFAGFFNTPEQMKKLFDGTAKGAVTNPRQYLIHFYRTRDEYIEHLRKDFPNIEGTNGIYVTNSRRAHFYEDPDNNNEATLFHEATHQLFFESHVLNRPIGEKAHFWVIEGIACYMESFQRKNGTFSIGDPGYVRFVDARINLLQKKYYVPLADFAKMGLQNFQQAPNLPKRYTQAAGLARFFMDYDNGRYREALVKHLTQLYSSSPAERDAAEGLDLLTGVPYADLDQQYAEDVANLETAQPK